MIGFAFLFLIVVVPLLGLTARLAIKPMVDAIVRLRESFPSSGGGVVERRVLQLEDEVQELSRQLHRLAEAEAFQREVLSLPSTPGRTITAAGSEGEPTRASMMHQDVI